MEPFTDAAVGLQSLESGDRQPLVCGETVAIKQVEKEGSDVDRRKKTFEKEKYVEARKKRQLM